MISLLFLSAVARGPGNAEIVYSARFYKHDEKRSYFHLYISRIDGSQRRQLTSGNADCLKPIWIDDGHIAYVRFDVPGSRFKEGINRWTGQVVLHNLRTGRSRVVAVGQSNYVSAETDENKSKLNLGSEWYLVTDNGRVSSVADTGVERLTGTLVESEIQPLKSGKYFIVDTITGATFAVQQRETEESTYLDSDVTDLGKVHRFRFRGDRIVAVRRFDNDRLMVITRGSYDRQYTYSRAYLVDVKAGTSRVLMNDVGGLEIRATEPYWAGYLLRDERLKVLKNGKTVWVNSLTTGNWQTGEQWNVADGYLQIDGWAIKPEGM